MNIQQAKNQKSTPPTVIDDIDFDFKPITSGLGFHHRPTEVKPVFTDRTTPVPVISPLSAVQPQQVKTDLNVYQNDLSLFYGNSTEHQVDEVPAVEEKVYRNATRSQRIFAYVLDLVLVVSIVTLVVMVMARTISMDLIEVFSLYPDEVTPLIVTLFCGFYLMYFSVFEKSSTTLGKTIFRLRVVDNDNKPLSLFSLLARSSISLVNFVSLGLFSWFDLQNKVTASKVIRIE